MTNRHFGKRVHSCGIVYSLLTASRHRVDVTCCARYKRITMKIPMILCLAAISVVPAFAGPRLYQPGRILSFDTGQQRVKNVKKAAKDELVYQVQINSTVYKVTNHSKKQEFSAGQDVQCRVEKTHLMIEKIKGGEVKYDILGEAAQQDHVPGTTP